jgi:hypothetical protein
MTKIDLLGGKVGGSLPGITHNLHPRVLVPGEIPSKYTEQ